MVFFNRKLAKLSLYMRYHQDIVPNKGFYGSATLTMKVYFVPDQPLLPW